MNLQEAITLLTSELDAETVATLIAQFLADTPMQVATLRETLATGDLATVGRTAHSVAGSSSTFGLQELRSAALSLEEMVKAGETAKLPGQIEVIAAAFDASVPDLERIIGS